MLLGVFNGLLTLRYPDSAPPKIIMSTFIVLGVLHHCQAAATLNANHGNLLFVAAADATTVYREQANLAYELQFTTSNGAINLTGVSLIPNTVGSATFNAYASGPSTVTVELVPGTAAPTDYTGPGSGTLNLSWTHDGVPGNANLNVELRAIDVAQLVVFEGYTSTSLADSDITPITINCVRSAALPAHWSP